MFVYRKFTENSPLAIFAPIAGKRFRRFLLHAHTARYELTQIRCGILNIIFIAMGMLYTGGRIKSGMTNKDSLCGFTNDRLSNKREGSFIWRLVN